MILSLYMNCRPHLFLFWLCMWKLLILFFSWKLIGPPLQAMVLNNFSTIVKICALFEFCWRNLFFIFAGNFAYHLTTKSHILIFQNMSKNLFYRPSGLVFISKHNVVKLKYTNFWSVSTNNTGWWMLMGIFSLYANYSCLNITGDELLGIFCSSINVALLFSLFLSISHH